MKLAILVLCFFSACVYTVSYGSGACNQIMYDKIYKDIIREAMKKGATRVAMEERNQTIETLRELCNGQKSSWEVHK